MAEKNNLLKNIFSLSLIQIANNLLPILSVPIIVRIIGPDKFGIINFATTVVSYFILLTNYSFDLTASRAIALNKDDLDNRSKVFNEVLYSKLLLLAFSLIIFICLLFFLPRFQNEKELAIFSFLIVFSFVFFPTWLYQGMQELYSIGIFNFVTKFLFTILVVIVVRQKEDYIWQPFIISVASIAVSLAAFFYAIKRYQIKIKKISIRNIFDVIWREKTVFFSYISINIYVTAGIIILGLMQSNKDVAFFSASWRLLIIIHTVVTTPLGLALYPYIGESFGISKEKGIERVKMTTPFVVGLTLIIAPIIWVFAPLIILLFYGEQFRPAILVFRIISLLPFFLGLNNLMGVQTMLNLKWDKAYSAIISLGAVIGIILNLVLINYFSFIGAAWSWLLTEVSIAILFWTYLLKNNIMLLDREYFNIGFLTSHFKTIIHPLKQKWARRND